MGILTDRSHLLFPQSETLNSGRYYRVLLAAENTVFNPKCNLYFELKKGKMEILVGYHVLMIISMIGLFSDYVQLTHSFYMLNVLVLL